MQTLSELVQSALNQVDVETASVKLASAADTSSSEATSMDEEEKKKKKKEEEAAASDSEKVSSAQVLDDSAYALKLAQCLEVAGSIVKTKLAEEASDAVPPAGSKDNAVGTMEATDNVPVNLPPAPKSTVESAVTTNATITEGEMPDSQGDYTGTPDWTNNKEAAEEEVTKKLEQAALLESLGETEKAKKLKEEAEKVADWTDPGDEKAQGRMAGGMLGATGAFTGANLGAALAYDTGKKVHPVVGALLGAATLGAAGALGGKALGEGSARSYKKQMADLGSAIGQGAAMAQKTSSLGLPLSLRKLAEDLSTSDEGIPSHAPSNEEAINLTKAVAKAKTQMEASEFLEQTPTKDPVVEASLDNTSVAKVSSLFGSAEKTAVSNKWIANKLQSAATKSAPKYMRPMTPIGKAYNELGARGVLAMTQAAGGKGARNEAARSMSKTIKDTKGMGLIDRVKHVQQAAGNPNKHDENVARYINRRVDMVRKAVRRSGKPNLR